MRNLSRVSAGLVSSTARNDVLLRESARACVGTAPTAPFMVSPVPLKDSFAAAPAALPAASGQKPAAASPAQADSDAGSKSVEQQAGEGEHHKEPLQQSRIAIVPGTGALVPRTSPIYHIGSLPTLFESPPSSDEVQFPCPDRFAERCVSA